MKTLANQTLLYDADCPLCRVYTKGFIDAGMLDENGKKPYCQLNEEEQKFVDVKRAANEIALVDNVNKTVIYGIDSLLKVIGYSYPWMEKVGCWKPIKFFLKKLYSLISYNRKVIIPSKINPAISLQCIPDFSFKYRFVFIFFAGLVASILNFNYLKLLHLEYLNFGFIVFAVWVQLPFQSLFLMQFHKETIVNYWGNLMTVSLFGGLIMIPVLVFNPFFNLNYQFNLIYFGITFLILIYEHYRRINLLELPKYLVIPWTIFMFYLFYLLL
jgi:hypothetical protein